MIIFRIQIFIEHLSCLFRWQVHNYLYHKNEIFNIKKVFFMLSWLIFSAIFHVKDVASSKNWFKRFQRFNLFNKFISEKAESSPPNTKPQTPNKHQTPTAKHQTFSPQQHLQPRYRLHFPRG